MNDGAKLDRIDIKIVKALHADARITNQALAELVGLSPSPCLQRVRRLERMGIIGPFYGRVDLDRLCHSVTVFGTASLRSHEHDDFQLFERLVREIPEAVACYKVSGTFDYLVQFRCRSIARYHELSDELLKACSGLVRLSSHVVLDETKEFAGLPLDALLEE